MKRGDPGINDLDRACKAHDITYDQTTDTTERHKADKILKDKAWERYRSSNASFGEKASALGVIGGMKVKMGLGYGQKKHRKPQLKKKSKTKKIPKAEIKRIFKHAVQSAKQAIKNEAPKSIKEASKIAKDAAIKAVIVNNNNKRPGKEAVKNGLPRVIKVPKIGGILPLVPIFAGLSALGALMGGTAGVASYVTSASNAKKSLLESERHNKIMEAIALGEKHTKGHGLYLGPYNKGLGLFLNDTFSKN